MSKLFGMDLPSDLVVREVASDPEPASSPDAGSTAAPSVNAPKKGFVVRVGRETKGRRGKGVTLISDLPLSETGMEELAAMLKQRCGTGGSVKNGQIEIQGDQRDRLTVELEKLGYKVKRVGG